MKNTLIILVVLLFSGLSKAQRLQPLQPYNENGYPKAPVTNLALGSSKFSEKFRIELLRIVNDGLWKAGESIRVDENNIVWIMDHVSYSEVKLVSFFNSGKKGDSIIFYPDVNFQGTAGIFEYGKCKLILYKTICMNLLEAPLMVQPTNSAPVVKSNSNAQSSPAITVQNSNYQQPASSQPAPVSLPIPKTYYSSLSGAYVNNHSNEDPFFDPNDDGTPVLNYQRFMASSSKRSGFGFTVNGFVITKTYPDGGYDYYNHNSRQYMHHTYSGESGVGNQQSSKPSYNMNANGNYTSNGGMNYQSGSSMNYMNNNNGNYSGGNGNNYSGSSNTSYQNNDGGNYSGGNGNGYSGNGGNYSGGSGTR